jgi:thiamine biosynthesis lipoprotein
MSGAVGMVGAPGAIDAIGEAGSFGTAGATAESDRDREAQHTRPAGALVSVSEPMMGGRVSIHLSPEDGDEVGARRDAQRVLDRMRAWAGRLTRFDASSELMRLNDAPATSVDVGPTLSAVLDWARVAEATTDGTVDVTLLDARLAAETGSWPAGAIPASRRWSFDRLPRGATVRRPPGIRFDLDGVAKGWMADRALAMLARHQVAVVDADGDVAIRPPSIGRLPLHVADPRGAVAPLVVLDAAHRPSPAAFGALPGASHGAPPDPVPTARTLGIATSGTSVHRWGAPGRAAHHLIDPRTRRPARTDLLQATVVADSAGRAEALAKTAVVLGSEAALERLSRPDVLAAILLTDRDELLVTVSTMEWLA